MSGLSAQRGSVMYIAPKDYMALRYEGAAVIVPESLIKREFIPDDIVEFDAVAMPQRESPLYNSSGLKPRWKALKIKFIKKANIIEGIGKVLNIDTKGEYCFIEHSNGGSEKYNIFCTRINAQPPIENLNSIFSPGSNIKFVAKEQAPTLKTNVKWRTCIVTDMKHDIKSRMNGKLRVYDVVPHAAPTSTAPLKLATPTAVARTAPKAPQASASVTSVPPSPASRIVGRELSRNTMTSVNTSQSGSRSSSSSRVESPIRPPMGSRSFAPPGLDHVLPSPTTSDAPHPLPSYDWMKFDLVTVLRSFPDQPAHDNRMAQENLKLRAIAHHLSNNMCNYCLSH